MLNGKKLHWKEIDSVLIFKQNKILMNSSLSWASTIQQHNKCQNRTLLFALSNLATIM